MSQLTGPGFLTLSVCNICCQSRRVEPRSKDSSQLNREDSCELSWISAQVGQVRGASRRTCWGTTGFVNNKMKGVPPKQRQLSEPQGFRFLRLEELPPLEGFGWRSKGRKCLRLLADVQPYWPREEQWVQQGSPAVPVTSQDLPQSLLPSYHNCIIYLHTFTDEQSISCSRSSKPVALSFISHHGELTLTSMSSNHLSSFSFSAALSRVRSATITPRHSWSSSRSGPWSSSGSPSAFTSPGRHPGDIPPFNLCLLS